MDLILRSKGFN